MNIDELESLLFPSTPREECYLRVADLPPIVMTTDCPGSVIKYDFTMESLYKSDISKAPIRRGETVPIQLFYGEKGRLSVATLVDSSFNEYTHTWSLYLRL